MVGELFQDYPTTLCKDLVGTITIFNILFFFGGLYVLNASSYQLSFAIIPTKSKTTNYSIVSHTARFFLMSFMILPKGIISSSVYTKQQVLFLSNLISRTLTNKDSIRSPIL